MPLIRTS